MSTPRDQALAFLRALFEHKPTGTVITVVQLPHAAMAHGYNAPGPVVDRVLGRAECYVGACALARQPGRGKRTADIAAFLPGAWIDVDINGSPVRGSAEPVTGHAPDWRTAVEAVFALAPPTFAVASGYGLQPWWLFNGGYVMHDAGEQARGERLVRGIQRRLAHDAGWEVDSTADLARILRIPGTTNDKDPARPMPVRLLGSGGPRYALDELEALGRDFADTGDGNPAKIARPPEHWVSVLRDGGDGNRHDRVWQLTGHLLARGIDPVEAWEVVRCWNDARVHPPYDEDTLFRRFREIARAQVDQLRSEFAQAWGSP